MPEPDREVCTACVMDRSDPDIGFDADGVCNHCREATELLARLPQTDEEADARLHALAERIRRAGEGRPYDSLLGVSGGVDSSYVAYLARRLELRPLVMHFDNGWNSELAVKNINRLVERLGFDLSTYVIDWQEFRDLQRAFLAASVVDIEMLTDHAITASMFRIAREHGIRYVLSGANVATESGLPRAWVWNKLDFRNIKAIHRRFGAVKLSSFPSLPTWRWLLIRRLGIGFDFVEVLDHARFRKVDAIAELEREVGWRYYGGKHYESVFTKFYQAYILPVKFGIDKRRAHLSSLIRNGEMSRDEALAELDRPPYDPAELAEDRTYVLKKLGFTDDEFDAIMRAPVHAHDDYPSDVKLVRAARRGKRLVERMAGGRSPFRD
ncbi:MAG: N-acetyl sugar amidotransferase [Planctomycetota bacterium]|jgi:N-acetyl sugar amidotransferase